MEEKKAVVKIKGAEYPLKCTVGFWSRVKEKCDITPQNISVRVSEDAKHICWLVMYGVYYGMAEKPESIEKMPFTIFDIENEIDRSIIDAIEQAVINGMTVEEKRIVEIAKQKQEEKFKELEEPKKGNG